MESVEKSLFFYVLSLPNKSFVLQIYTVYTVCSQSVWSNIRIAFDKRTARILKYILPKLMQFFKGLYEIILIYKTKYFLK